MNIDLSKYQSNVIVTNAETFVKSQALEEASIPDNLGFIIKPSSASNQNQNENQAVDEAE